MNTRSQTGFTLYELLITFLIVGVVLTLGIPNLADFTRNSRITSTANDLHAAFLMSRSEAARAKANITICASADPFAANADCDGTWDQGYIVFEDTNGDITHAAGETVLRAHGPIADGVSMAVKGGATYFSYAATGLGRGDGLDGGGGPALSQVLICDNRGNITASGGNSAGRLFVATPLGRATIVREKDRVQMAIDSGLACP